jgi:hypothetical protein
MGFFKKEVKPEANHLDLPNFPTDESNNLPILPDLPETEEFQQKPLPTFSKTQTNNNLGMQTIKENIQYKKSENFETHNIDTKNERRSYELDSLPPTNQFKIEKSTPVTMDNKPIFVKIDKFKEAAAKFEEIKSRVYEIEASLNKIKQVKQEEEQELKTWEQEIKIVKEKISNIDSSLFNKI